MTILSKDITWTAQFTQNVGSMRAHTERGHEWLLKQFGREPWRWEGIDKVRVESRFLAEWVREAQADGLEVG